MANNYDIEPALFKRLSRWTWQARALLIWETYALTLAPAMLATLLFCSFAFLGIWERIGDPWRAIALLGTLFFTARSLRRILSLRFPTRSDAQRRLERDSGQAHRPLDTLRDRPALSIDHETYCLIRPSRVRLRVRRSTRSMCDRAS